MAYDITDLLFKLSQNRRPTSESKRLLEEEAHFANILIGQQVWNTALDPDPAVAVVAGAAALDTDLALTADPTTPVGEENSIWLSSNSNYIPPNVVPGDAGYTTTIKDNAGTIIPDGKLDEYGVLFLHKPGVLLIQDPVGFASEYSFPPKITSYRYIGTLGLGGGGSGGGPTISGTPGTYEVTFWTSPTSIGGLSNVKWDAGNSRFTLGSTIGLQWVPNKTLITAPDNGSLRISNDAGNDFEAFILGAPNASFPAIYRDMEGLQFRTGDNLNYTHIKAGRIDAEERLRLKEQASAPSSVATYGMLYTKTDGHLYFLDSSGVETDLLDIVSEILPGNCLSGDAVGDFVYITGNKVAGRVQVTKVDITNVSKMPAVGVIVNKDNPTTCDVQWSGEVLGVFTGLTAGSVYFVDTGGTATASLPTPGSDFYIQKVGIATSADSMVLYNDANLVKKLA